MIVGASKLTPDSAVVLLVCERTSNNHYYSVPLDNYIDWKLKKVFGGTT